jgi:hypothetical protein
LDYALAYLSAFITNIQDDGRFIFSHQHQKIWGISQQNVPALVMPIMQVIRATSQIIQVEKFQNSSTSSTQPFANLRRELSEKGGTTLDVGSRQIWCQVRTAH